MEIRIDETSETQNIKCKEYRTGARHMTMVIKNCVQCGMTAYYVIITKTMMYTKQNIRNIITL
jgi:hypothetical protein